MAPSVARQSEGEEAALTQRGEPQRTSRDAGLMFPPGREEIRVGGGHFGRLPMIKTTQDNWRPTELIEETKYESGICGRAGDGE